MKKTIDNIVYAFFSMGIMACSFLQAQIPFRSEAGVFLGTSYYQGDIPSQGKLPDMSLAGGVIYRYNFNPRWSLRGSLYFGKIWGDDVLLKQPEEHRMGRNLRFESPLRELSVQVEFNFLDYATGSRSHRVTPYIYSGVSLFSFDPRAEYVDAENGSKEMVSLRDLGTEGQGSPQYPDRKPYSLIQPSIPVGLGMKFSLSSYFCLSLEWGLRWTFTDYLDDVSTTYVETEVLEAIGGDRSLALASGLGSEPRQPGTQRGNTNAWDVYTYAGVTITMNLGAFGSKSCNAYRNGRF